MRNYLILIIFCLSIVSCRSSRLQKKGIDLGNNSPADSITTAPSLVINKVDFSQIRFKSEIDLNSKLISQKFPITIQLQKDSIIWATVSMGLEVGRAKITQDSLQFLDRFNRRVYKGTWDELSKAGDFPLNFALLQSLLIGEMPFNIQIDDKITLGNTVSTVIQKRNDLVFESKIDNSVHKFFEMTGHDAPNSNNQLDLKFSRFVEQDSQLFPALASLILNGKNNIKLYLTHSKIELSKDGFSFPFNVPTHYKVEPLPGI